jgi:hypothetical protein
MEQPLAPATPPELRQIKVWAWLIGIFGWLILTFGFGWDGLLTTIGCPVVGVIYFKAQRRYFFTQTERGRSYAAACREWLPKYQAWQAELYRQQLQTEAMNDWVRMTGGQYEPTVEWVVTRMHAIEQERATAAHRQQQTQLQGLQLLGIAALLGEQRRTARAVNNLNNRLR